MSAPARIAEPGAEVTMEELQLAARNHGLPLEAMGLDPTPVGLHYLLTHYDIPLVDPAAYRLTVAGRVDRPLSLDLAALRSLPRRTVTATMECAGNGRARLSPRPISQPWLVEAVGTARWSGTPLAGLLGAAGLGHDAVDVVFTGLDHGVERGVEQDYQFRLPLEEALREEVLLVDEMNGAPLPVQHGFPLRLVAPGWYGMVQVKWLASIDVVATPFDGFQVRTYRWRADADDEGEPLTRMEPRALVRPPGFPDFMSRARALRPGRTTLEGRAWSGWAPIRGVDVSVDGGRTWDAAIVDQQTSPWAWTRWSWVWEAEPGEFCVQARAHDTSGRTQPLAPPWNRGGFANNSPHQVRVVVQEAAPTDG